MKKFLGGFFVLLGLSPVVAILISQHGLLATLLGIGISAVLTLIVAYDVTLLVE